MIPKSDGAEGKRPSARTLAELARSGFSYLRDPSKRLAFEVHHVNDRPAYLHDVLQGTLRGEPEPPPFIETLTTAAHGVGLVIGTYDVSNIFDEHARGVGVERPKMLDYPNDGYRIYRGQVDPDVNFVYDSARQFEGLIEIDSGATKLELRHAHAIRDVAHFVAKTAVETAAGPILSLQCPVQVPAPNLLDTGAQPESADLPASAAIAVRFIIALDQPNAKRRLEIADAFVAFCEQNNFGFWIADGRLGFRPGNWFPVLSRRPDHLHVHGSVSYRDTRAAETSLPVTLVGPARIGSTLALLENLKHYPDIGILACSMTAIDDMAFIHLQLCAEGVAKTQIETLNQRLDATWKGEEEPNQPHRISAPVLLRHILPLLVREPRLEVPAATRAYLAERAGDYEMLVGPAQTLAASLLGDRRALWVAWEIEGSKTELREPFIALHDALVDLGLFGNSDSTRVESGPNMEYLICRKVRGSVLRGKGKLSIKKDTFERYDLNTLIVSIERAWRRKLPEEIRVRELTVSWREFWLGHWTNPLD